MEKLSHCRKWAPGLTKDPALQGTDCSDARAEAFTFSWLLREIYVRSKNKFVNIHNRIRHDLILQRETQQMFSDQRLEVRGFNSLMMIVEAGAQECLNPF